MSNEERKELESLLITCDYKGKEVKAEALKKLLDDARLNALKDSKFVTAAVNRLIDLRCPECGKSIGTTLQI